MKICFKKFHDVTFDKFINQTNKIFYKENDVALDERGERKELVNLFFFFLFFYYISFFLLVCVYVLRKSNTAAQLHDHIQQFYFDKKTQINIFYRFFLDI